MKHKLTQNWGLKLVSFICAAILWLIITNINDPIGTFRVFNVPVKIQNADLITNNGQVYEILDNTDVIDMVTISAKRSIIDSLDESNIVATADVNDLTNLNTIAIRLSTNKYNDKLESITGSIDKVKLNIENNTTKTLPIRIDTTGTVKEGYMIGESSLEQNLIEISGPESIISQIKRAAAIVNVSGFTNRIDTDSEVRLYDENDKVISSNSIVKNISKVRVTVEILEMKTIPINYEVMGIPARGYEATGEITASKKEVTIAGKSKAVANINSIDIPETALDITGATESLEAIIDLRDYLPDGVVLAEEDFQGKISINVSVEQITEKTVTMFSNRIQILNMPEGFEAEIVEENEVYTITLVGLARDLDALDIGAIQASIDIGTFMEEREMETLSAGHYTMELLFNLDETVELKEAVNVRLNVTEIEED